jgi:hypothetical protein
MSKYFSAKRVTQDKSDPIFDVARQEFGKLATRLKEGRIVKGSEILEKEGLELSLLGAIGKSRFDIYLYPGGEVFSRRINGSYETFQTAYDVESKTKLLRELLKEAETFIKSNDYYEEVYERKGRIVYRKIVFADGSSESQSVVRGGRLMKGFGSTKRLIKPHN